MPRSNTMPPDAIYAVKFNTKEGTLEVTAPDGEWVASRVEELRQLLATAPPSPPSVDDATTSAQPDGGGAADKASRTKEGRGREPKRRGRVTGGRVRVDEELRAALDANVSKKLGEYIEARRRAWDDSISAQVAIIATFLEDELGREGVDPSEVYTVYDVMGERPPANVRSALTNARQRSRYFGAITDGRWQLSQKGQNFGRFDSVTPADVDD